MCDLNSSPIYELSDVLGSDAAARYYSMNSFICHQHFHYENMPMQLTEIFLALKIENFQLINFDIFLIFAQNIDCRYTLEPPRRGGSNEYPQSMFSSKNKKNRYTPPYPSFAKVGFKGVYIARTCFPDVFEYNATVDIYLPCGEYDTINFLFHAPLLIFTLFPLP